ncbi:MAG: DUF362 domain-containing protein [Elusimicrobiota bacterium]
MSNISLIKCDNYKTETLKKSIEKSIELAGGINQFIKKGEKILVKPNLLGAHTPEEAVTTHPEFVRAVLHLVKDAGATPLLGDSPSLLGYNNILEKTRMAKIALEEKVEILNFQLYDNVTINGIHITKYVFDLDGIISLPKLKTHSLCTLTAAIKNLFGLVPGLTKTQYHLKYRTTRAFSEILALLFEAVKKKLRLVIIDGITGQDEEGPANGRVRNFDMIIAGVDAVSIDTAVFELFGTDSSKVLLLKICKNKNLGETQLSNISIATAENNFKLSETTLLNQWKIKDPHLPKGHIINIIPEFVGKVLAKFIWIKPYIKPPECRLCMKCTEICPAGAIEEKTKKGKKYLLVNRKKCISCFCCNEVCPHASIKTVDSLMLKTARKILSVLRSKNDYLI